ncbi:GDSL-type esterase/lipase family protein [Schumannella soli]|uniref:GDSL-type esterase/lipase family protein n=1 Tax=Schumannella soli TaxID=2590779 RepID=UPI0015E85F50|nr:GDSL-type esterase/lipase family protein [Schumannella soli]
MTRLWAALLAPVIVPQGRRLSAATPRLAAPTPEPDAAELADPRLEVLVLGDSTAIGTGVDRVEDALAAALARERGAGSGSGSESGDEAGFESGAVLALGRNGATAAEVRAEFLDRAAASAASAVVVVVGWNDAMKLRPTRAFARDLTTIVRTLQAHRLGRRVIVVAPPHFERFAVLPQPLRCALGAHAAGLRRTAARVCRTWGATLAPGIDGASASPADRFHPDAAGYRRLAQGIAAALRE